MRRFLARLNSLFHRGRDERELAREVAAHLALIQEDFERRGMPPDAARLAARRAYGGVDYAMELQRDARGFPGLEQAVQDVRHAWRSLAKSPGFVAVALLSLAFGIGVNTAIFTLVNGILLKSLPVPDAHRLVQVKAHFKEFDSSAFTFPAYRELARRSDIFADTAGVSGGLRVLDTGGQRRKVEFQMVTGSFFRFLGGRPALGRLIDEEDDRVEGAHPVCVLGYQAWQAYFGGDPGVVNRTIQVDGVPVQVVGVAAADFAGAELQRRVDVWVPTAMTADFTRNRRANPNVVWISMLARLRPGISSEEASARLAAASAAIEETLPKDRANANATYIMVDGSKGLDRWRTSLHDPLVILMGAVTLILLVACANLANLLLARTNERQQEFAIKLALGISRWRLMRQALLETVLLAMAGGAAALLLAGGLTRFLLTLFNSGNRYQALNVAPDASVFFYTLCGCLLTALIAGLYPAWRASCATAGPGLKGAALRGHQRSFVRRSLILVQVALAVVLLFGASLFSHSLRNLKTIDLGFDMDRVLTVNIGDSGPRQNLKPQIAPPALAAVLDRVRQLPGVQSAAFTEPGPLSGGMMGTTTHVTDARGTRAIDTNVMFAGTDFFHTLRVPILRGRDFTAADRKGAPPVLIVNQRLASLLAPGGDLVGMRIDAWDLKNAEIVGVAGNSKYQGVREEAKAIVYEPFDQAKVTGGVLEIRCRSSLAAIDRDVRRIVRASAPGYQVSDATPLDVLRDNLIAQDRLLSFLSTLFGVLGAALALIGIYGLISYSVTRRTREIGIRISVGAQTSDVLWLVLREALLLVAAGVLAGLPLALRLSETIRKMLYQVSTSEPLDIWVTIVLMVAGGLIASWIPGRHAARIDPVRALRYD